MAYLIGTDEAGYGPNLGPLVISATLWHVPDVLLDQDLYSICSDSICAVPAEADGMNKLVIADSKILYKSRGKLRRLESSLLASLADLGKPPTCWLDAWRLLTPDAVDLVTSIPWYANFSAALPLDAEPATIDRLAAVFRHGQQRAAVRLQAIHSVAIFPAEFNGLVQQHDSKGAVLSEQTIGLVARLIAGLDDQPVLVQCDKHGGRNRYGALLQHAFADQVVRVLQESRVCSRYQWGPTPRRVEIRFTAKGESFLPAALASMASKYLRELAMTAFNAFWIGHVPGLRPTAGYPVDALRFKADIAGRQQQLGLSDHMLWRIR